MPYQAADSQVDAKTHGAAMGPLVHRQMLYSPYKPGGTLRKTASERFRISPSPPY